MFIPLICALMVMKAFCILTSRMKSTGELELPDKLQPAQHEILNRDIYGGVRNECYWKLTTFRGVLCVCMTYFLENKLAIWFEENYFWIRRFDFSLVVVGFDHFGTELFLYDIIPYHKYRYTLKIRYFGILFRTVSTI